MAEHKDLTGADLHEPKGVATANNNEVYHANGSGSGTWKDPLDRVLNLNSFSLSSFVPDVSETHSAWFYVPQDGTVERISGILQGPITVANAVLTLYKNGVNQSKTLTINYSGSVAGSMFSNTVSPVVNVVAGDVLELRSDGGSTGVSNLYVTLSLKAS